eukprot:scaffold10617_cov18-Tisochrysis_lutea.AAC.1
MASKLLCGKGGGAASHEDEKDQHRFEQVGLNVASVQALRQQGVAHAALAGLSHARNEQVYKHNLPANLLGSAIGCWLYKRPTSSGTIYSGDMDMTPNIARHDIILNSMVPSAASNFVDHPRTHHAYKHTCTILLALEEVAGDSHNLAAKSTQIRTVNKRSRLAGAHQKAGQAGIRYQGSFRNGDCNPSSCVSISGVPWSAPHTGHKADLKTITKSAHCFKNTSPESDWEME